MGQIKKKPKPKYKKITTVVVHQNGATEVYKNRVMVEGQTADPLTFEDLGKWSKKKYEILLIEGLKELSWIYHLIFLRELIIVMEGQGFEDAGLLETLKISAFWIWEEILDRFYLQTFSGRWPG